MNKDTANAPLPDRKLARRAAGLIPAFLFALGVARLVAGMNNYDIVGLTDSATVLSDVALSSDMIWMTVAVTLAILSVCFYNKITTGITFAGLIGAAAWLLTFGDVDIGEVYKAVVDFFRLSIPALGSGDTLPLDFQLIMVRVICVSAAFIAYVTAARLAGALSLTVVAAALFLLAWFLGYTEIFFELALVSAAIASVSAASYGRKRARCEWIDVQSHAAAGVHGRVATSGGTAGLALFAIPVMLACALLLTNVVISELAEAMHSRKAAVFMDDVVDYVGRYIPGYTRRRMNFSIETAGFNNSEQLGGPVYLSKSPSMTVIVNSSAHPSYLRGATRSAYTGTGWTNDDMGGSYRFGSDMWAAVERETFDRELPVDNSDIASYVRYTVSPYRHSGTIFTIERPETVTISDETFTAHYNEYGEIFPDNLMDMRMEYSVVGWTVNSMSDDLVRFIAAHEGDYREDAGRMESIRNRYGGGEPNKQSLHYRTAHDITSQYRTDIEKARAIMVYLRSYRYTLHPSSVPDGVDFVDYFLQSREGYCVYFASAMAVMARDVGIPSRYVEGYLLSEDVRMNTMYQLTGEQAHAWAELYFEGFGWLRFDATGMGDSVGGYEAPILPEVTPTPSAPPTTALPEASARPSRAPNTTDGEPSEQGGGIAVTALVVLLLIGGAAGGAALYLREFEQRRLVSKRGNGGAVMVWWREVERMLPLLSADAVRHDGESGMAFAARVEELRVTDEGFAAFGWLAMRAFYGDAELSDSDTAYAYALYRSVCARVRKRLTVIGYVVRRIAR